MKPKSLIYLLVVLAILLAGCGAPKTAPASTQAPTGSTTPQKGGAIVVVYKDDLATLDPAIGYDWTNWPAIKMVFDGLLDYDDSTNLTPRLAAEMPTVNKDA